MALKAIVNKERYHLERLTFLPILAALVLVWGGLVTFTLAERTSALDRAQSQLQSTVATLADFNELADRSEATAAAQTNASRTAAFWRALVQYPTASFWVESRRRIIAGQPPVGERVPSIVAHDTRAAFTVRAALPEADALVGWERGTRQSVAALAAVTLGFLILTRFLSKALRQRAAAEREAAASSERATQLAQYRAELQETVAHRTEELAQSNSHLETELAERRAVQSALREHDALLNAVTKSAAELLGTQNYEDAIATVLALIGTTISVSRVLTTEIAADGTGHFRSSLRHEWSAPGIPPILGDPRYQGVDLTAFPALVDRLAAGELAPFYIEEIPQPYRSLCERASIQSILHIPILVSNAFWGSLNFIDASSVRREWSWAETDTLKTLAGLVGMAITRARYIEELADADTIVQNSPTILYRLRGEPAFPLMYISSNVAKFGHDPATLMGSPHWAQSLIEPLDVPIFQAAMTRLLQPGAKGDSVEFRLRTGSGEEHWVENRYSPRRDQDGRLLEVEGIIIDVTDRKAAEAKIALLARTDSLTGLANRATFLERLRHAFAATARGARGFAVLYLDLDYFKPVNDTLGHAAGDALLREVAARLVKSARDTDLVARLGGDEFALLQADFDEPESAGMLAARIVHSVALPYLIEGSEVRISASIGICPHSARSSGPDEMLAQADVALYRAKEQGRNQYRFYSENLDRQVLGRVQLADDLRRALEGTELELYYEPQVELNTGRTAGAKALVRWHHPTRGLLQPDDFIPILEKTATGIALGHWLLERACQELSRRRAAGAALPVVAVDIRFAQLKNGDELVRNICDTLARFSLVPSDLELDVTEETLAQATLTHNDSLTRLHELGVKIAIADFGTKCSSFEYLRAYSVSRIELSQSFISGAFAQPERAAAIRDVVALAEETGIGIITQGLETPGERAMLFSPRVRNPNAREVATSKRPA